jgi:hypothetical protein
MRRAIVAFAILLGVALSTQAYADAGASTAAPAQTTAAPHPAPQQAKKSSAPARKPGATQSSANEVTYDRDSKNPNVGWHTQGGMRVCTQDCDNPEIPGSGYTCKNVNFLGMAMRECDWSSF